MDSENQYGVLHRQEYYLPMMDEIHRYCLENKIKYSLSGGTLLGAVRHKGFIPWDDDIDIMFDRENYDRFLRCFAEKPMDEFVLIDGIWVKRLSRQDNPLIASEEQCVDLFVFDKIPPSFLAEKLKLFMIEMLQGMMKTKLDYGKYTWYQKALIWVTHTIGLLFTKEKKQAFFDSVSRWGNDSQSKTLNVYNTFFNQIRRTRYPEEILSSYIPLMFEGRSYLAIVGYDTYLKEIYGDYMQLPPEKDRKPKHTIMNEV